MSKPLSGLFSGTSGERQKLISELRQRGEKFNEKELIAITKDHNKQIVWLEKGNNFVGLKHIFIRHAKQFATQGISKDEIPKYLMTAIKNGKIIGYQGAGTGRPIYELTYKGKIQRVAISIGSNGFIVGANPKHRLK